MYKTNVLSSNLTCFTVSRFDRTRLELLTFVKKKKKLRITKLAILSCKIFKLQIIKFVSLGMHILCRVEFMIFHI